MSSIAGARALVTGGAGLIGSHIVDQLIEGGAAEVVVLDNFVRGRRANLSTALASGRVTVVEGDIRDGKLVGYLMEGIDFVFHQAAIRITQCAEEPRQALEVLVDGSFNVIEAAARRAVRKIVVASSASVYGLAKAFPTDEEHAPYDNRTIYGAAKLFNEGMLRSFHDMFGLNYVALRYFNVYGLRMDVYGAYTEVLIRWMERIASGNAPVLFGDGTESMDFVHAADVARANLLAAAADVTDEVMNVGSGVETSLSALVTMLLKAMDSPLKPEYGPVRKVNPVNRRQADTCKARLLLGFDASIPLDRGLAELVAWWEEERSACRT